MQGSLGSVLGMLGSVGNMLTGLQSAASIAPGALAELNKRRVIVALNARRRNSSDAEFSTVNLPSDSFE